MLNPRDKSPGFCGTYSIYMHLIHNLDMTGVSVQLPGTEKLYMDQKKAHRKEFLCCVDLKGKR